MQGIGWVGREWIPYRARRPVGPGTAHALSICPPFCFPTSVVHFRFSSVLSLCSKCKCTSTASLLTASAPTFDRKSCSRLNVEIAARPKGSAGWLAAPGMQTTWAVAARTGQVTTLARHLIAAVGLSFAEEELNTHRSHQCVVVHKTQSQN